MAGRNLRSRRFAMPGGSRRSFPSRQFVTVGRSLRSARTKRQRSCGPPRPEAAARAAR